MDQASRRLEATFTRENEVLGYRCGWYGCAESFHGEQPPGWVNLIVYHAPQPVLRIRDIEGWHHDKVLCPKHSRAVDELLHVGTHMLRRLGNTATTA